MVIAPTYEDLVTFVLLNRGTNAFAGMTQEEIEYDIYVAMTTGQFIYDTDEDGKITGYLQYYVNEDDKILYVYQNIALSLARLKSFLDAFLVKFPGYHLKAMRHGHPVAYDIDKLLTKLTYYGRRISTK